MHQRERKRENPKRLLLKKTWNSLQFKGGVISKERIKRSPFNELSSKVKP
jgi:hypothetical protein